MQCAQDVENNPQQVNWWLYRLLMFIWIQASLFWGHWVVVFLSLAAQYVDFVTQSILILDLQPLKSPAIADTTFNLSSQTEVLAQVY